MLRIPRQLEYIYTFVTLWFLFGNPVSLLQHGADGDQAIDTTMVASNFLLPGLTMALCSVAFALLFLNWKAVLQRIRVNPQILLVLLFVLIVFASCQWSDYPDYSFRRALLMVWETAFVIYFFVRFDLQDQLLLLSSAFAATILLCLAFSLLIPQYGTMTVPPHIGAWRGVFSHKNKLGPQMALSTVFLFVCRNSNIYSGSQKLFFTLMMCLSATMIVLSQSTTGLLATIFMILAFFAFSTLRLNYKLLTPAVSFVMAAAILSALYVWFNASNILGIFGKGTDLTGRDELWPAIWQSFLERPFLGYGYEAFWQGRASAAAQIWKAVGWPSPHAHNGFLEILLSVGILGGIVFLCSFLLNTTQSLKLIYVTKKPYAILPILVLLLIVINNTTESTLFLADIWVLYVWLSLVPATIATEYRRTAVSAVAGGILTQKDRLVPGRSNGLSA